MMSQIDPYTEKVRKWSPVKKAVSDAKADLQANAGIWRTQHMTDPRWLPGMTDPPQVDPNAWGQWVATPAGTDPRTAASHYALWMTTGQESDQLHYAAIGSFGVYVTLDNLRCDGLKYSAQLTVWMYNSMDSESFGKYAGYFPHSGQARQYMWWNWQEAHSWNVNRGYTGGSAASRSSDGW